MSDQALVIDIDAEVAALKDRIRSTAAELEQTRRDWQRAKAGGHLTKARELEQRVATLEYQHGTATEAFKEGRSRLLIDEYERRQEIIGRLDEECDTAAAEAVAGFATAWGAVQAYIEARSELARVSRRMAETAQKHGLPPTGERPFALPNGELLPVGVPTAPAFAKMGAHFAMRVEELGRNQMTAGEFSVRHRGSFPQPEPH